MFVLEAWQRPKAEIESIKDKEEEEFGLRGGLDLMVMKLIKRSVVKLINEIVDLMGVDFDEGGVIDNEVGSFPDKLGFGLQQLFFHKRKLI